MELGCCTKTPDLASFKIFWKTRKVKQENRKRAGKIQGHCETHVQGK